jgi:hypothetical protein
MAYQLKLHFLKLSLTPMILATKAQRHKNFILFVLQNQHYHVATKKFAFLRARPNVRFGTGGP